MPGRIRNVVHIKHRTAGTSNELSFDVLEAKKVAADAASRTEKGTRSGFKLGRFSRAARREARKNKAEAPTTMPKLYTNDASLAAKNIERAGLPYGDPAAEVHRRKRRRARVRIITGAIVVAIVGAFGFFAFAEVSRYMADQNQTLALLDEALQTIETTDETIVAMDELVMKPIDEQDTQTLDSITSQLADTSKQLDAALTQAQYASENLVNARQREAANQAITAITARQEMINEGRQLVEEGKRAQQAADNMNEAWPLILEADALTQDAGNLVAYTTEANVTTSMDKTNQAIEKFKEAQKKIQWVVDNYPAADVSAYATYLERRIEGQEAALDSDAAMLLMDRDTAEEKNQVLYDCDSEAAQIAQGFSEDPTEPVVSAYQANSEELREKYLQARSQAASADTYLRDYLGETNK